MSTTTTTQRTELLASIEMAQEGIAWCEANGEPVSDKQREVLARLEATLEGLQGGEGNLIHVAQGTGQVMRLTDRPAGGRAHRNQYGACRIENASEKQCRFIKSLMDRKDLTPLEDSVVIDVARLRMQVATNTVNKKAASAIIDRLLALPERTVATPEQGPVPTARPASDKQYGFITRLLGEKEISAEDTAKVIAAVEGKTLSTKGASATIDKLMALPRRTAPQVQVEAGVYVTADGSVYRVYFGQNSGQMLAAKVVEHEDGTADFEYAGKADRFITATSRKMTLEEAARFGKATGTCIVCARRLDVPESVDRGIGPVCFAKMGY